MLVTIVFIIPILPVFHHTLGRREIPFLEFNGEL
jgi:hypothetical protein